MNIQHALLADRWPACAFRIGIERLDDRAKALSGKNLVYLIKNLFPAGRHTVPLKSFIGKGQLTHEQVLQAT